MPGAQKLERALRDMLLDEGRLHEFYRTFLDSDVLVLGKAGGRAAVSQKGFQIYQPGCSLRLRFLDIDGGPTLLLFSSPPRLEAVFGREVEAGEVVDIKAATLLKILEDDVRVVLNPDALETVEWSPSEIKALLDGSIFSSVRVAPEREPGTYHLKVPDPQPKALEEALSNFFKSCPAVRRAYLAQRLGRGPRGRALLAGIQMAGGNLEEIHEDAMLAGVAALAPGETLDLELLAPGPVASFMTGRLRPFYARTYWLKAVSELNHYWKSWENLY